MKNHYQNIQLYIERALAHGADSPGMEERIREECINKYVETMMNMWLSKFVNDLMIQKGDSVSKIIIKNTAEVYEKL